jgi:hypothetical protein
MNLQRWLAASVCLSALGGYAANVSDHRKAHDGVLRNAFANLAGADPGRSRRRLRQPRYANGGSYGTKPVPVSLKATPHPRPEQRSSAPPNCVVP